LVAAKSNFGSTATAKPLATHLARIVIANIVLARILRSHFGAHLDSIGPVLD